MTRSVEGSSPTQSAASQSTASYSAASQSTGSGVEQARAYQTQSVVLSEKVNDLKCLLAGVTAVALLLVTGGSFFVHTKLATQDAQIRRQQSDLQKVRDDLEAREHSLVTVRATQKQLVGRLHAATTKAASATARYEQAKEAAANCAPKRQFRFRRRQASDTATLPGLPSNTGCDPHDPLCSDLGV
jgi:hypothetical protein